MMQSFEDRQATRAFNRRQQSRQHRRTQQQVIWMLLLGAAAVLSVYWSQVVGR